MKKFISFTLFFVSLTTKAHAADVLTLDSYLSNMKARDPAYQAENANQTAARQEAYNGDLLTSPQFFLNADTGQDKSPTVSPSSNGTLKSLSEVQTGIQMQTDFGLSGQIFVGESDTKISGASPNYLPPDNTQLVLQSYGAELQFPLLKNGFGRDIQLKKQSIQNASDANNAYSKFQQLQLENKARLIYLKVEKLLETIELQKMSLAQGESLVRWVKERVDTKILEESDLSQSIASMQARDLNLQSSLLSLAEAKKDFNTMLGLEPNHPLPNLQHLTQLVPNTVLIQHSPLVRSDIKALTKSIAADKSSYLAKQENYKPELNIIGKAASFTKQSDNNDTARCTSIQACSQFYIGMTLSVPLDFEATENSIAATESRIKAKELSLEDAKKQSISDIQKLFQTSRLLKMQRDLSSRIITTQKMRLDQEHKRQLYGRASAFDIIRAEQDYTESQLNLLAIIYSQAEVNTNYKLFEESAQ